MYNWFEGSLVGFVFFPSTFFSVPLQLLRPRRDRTRLARLFCDSIDGCGDGKDRDIIIEPCGEKAAISA